MGNIDYIINPKIKSIRLSREETIEKALSQYKSFLFWQHKGYFASEEDQFQLALKGVINLPITNSTITEFMKKCIKYKNYHKC